MKCDIDFPFIKYIIKVLGYFLQIANFDPALSLFFSIIFISLKIAHCNYSDLLLAPGKLWRHVWMEKEKLWIIVPSIS